MVFRNYALSSFITNHKQWFYKMEIPQQLRTFAHQHFQNSSIEFDKIGVELFALCLEMNNTATLGIKRRLLAASSPTIYQKTPFCLSLSGPSNDMITHLDKIVRQCCAFVLKPLAYIQRGVTPPSHLHNTVFYLDTPQMEIAIWWRMLIFREVWTNLTQHCQSSIKYCPKQHDVYHSPQFRYPWDRVCDFGIVPSNFDGDDTIEFQSTGIQICFALNTANHV
eukprot:2888208-Rhodomonas_salina.1